MITNVSRRCFLKSTAAGVVSAGALAALTERLSAMSAQPALGPKSKVRIGKLYLGREHPGWPTHKVDLNADMKSFEASLAKLGAGLADVEFVEGGLIANDQQLAAAKEKFKGVDGILVDSPDDGHRGAVAELVRAGHTDCAVLAALQRP